MNNVLSLKKHVPLSSITLDFRFEMLEDGSLWYCTKLSTQDNWGEWVTYKLEEENENK
jgi:hypothetical protein